MPTLHTFLRDPTACFPAQILIIARLASIFSRLKLVRCIAATKSGVQHRLLVSDSRRIDSSAKSLDKSASQHGCMVGNEFFQNEALFFGQRIGIGHAAFMEMGVVPSHSAICTTP